MEWLEELQPTCEAICLKLEPHCHTTQFLEILISIGGDRLLLTVDCQKPSYDEG
jgi:hypothetical protein